MAKTILEMKGISKSYGGIKALNDVKIELYEGEILCLLGENGAGKSTLMKILSGAILPSEGSIYMNGELINIKNPEMAHNHGISTVYQELIQFPDMTIMENIFIGRYPKKNGLVDFAELRKRTLQLMDVLDIHFEPDEYIRNLSVAQRQLVEIMKAVSFDSKIIIFDEPTSSLTTEETAILFRIIDDLKKKNISMIYISHRLEDIFAIGDRITVLRDGQNSGGGLVKDLNTDQVIALMVGRNVENQFPKKEVPIGEEILRVEHITNEHVNDASFALRKGEILGFGGLVGAGRSELIRAIMGLDKCSGKIYKDGKEIINRSPADAINNHFALVPEDRKDQGLVLIRTLLHNIEMSSLKKLSHFGFMNGKQETEYADRYMKQLHVKAAGSYQQAGDLSGGNQQKVIFGKWLERSPSVFMMDDPTRGIDVGAKYEIYELIINMAKQGKTIIVVSSEMPEILGITNRIGVMSNGRLAGIVNTKETDQEELLRLSAKYL